MFLHISLPTATSMLLGLPGRSLKPMAHVAECISVVLVRHHAMALGIRALMSRVPICSREGMPSVADAGCLTHPARELVIPRPARLMVSSR